MTSAPSEIGDSAEPRTIQEIIDRSSHGIITDGAGRVHSCVHVKLSDLRRIEAALAALTRPEAPSTPQSAGEADTFTMKAMMPRELHPATKRLVFMFACALADKLRLAEQKYGYSDGWQSPDWMDECRAKLLEHVAKGDPRDVAAYCAFLWHHKQTTAAQPADEGSAFEDSVERLVASFLSVEDCEADMTTTQRVLNAVGRMKKDAERYRNWRVMRMVDAEPDGLDAVKSTDDFDAAIDAAISPPTQSLPNAAHNQEK